MFSYTISKVADNQTFKDTYALIENTLTGFEKVSLLIDADGSLIQIYYTCNGDIKVFNDYEVDAVYVDSELDLSMIFNS